MHTPDMIDCMYDPFERARTTADAIITLRETADVYHVGSKAIDAACDTLAVLGGIACESANFMLNLYGIREPA